MATKKGVSLSVGRGEKLPVSKGAGLTAKGREKYNAATGSNLKPPAPNPKTKADAGRKASFCARMEGVVKNAKGDAERAKAEAAVNDKVAQSEKAIAASKTKAMAEVGGIATETASDIVKALIGGAATKADIEKAVKSALGQ